MRHSSAVIFT